MIMKRIICIILASILVILTACSVQSSDSPAIESVSPAQSAQSIDGIGPLTDDIILLKMRDALLNSDIFYTITYLGGSAPDDGIWIRVDKELLQKIADALTHCTPKEKGGWSDYQPDTTVTAEINIDSSKYVWSDGPYSVGVGLLNGDTALVIQLGGNDGPDKSITASYLFDSDAIFTSIKELVDNNKNDKDVEITGNYRSFELGANEHLVKFIQIDDQLIALTKYKDDSNTGASPAKYDLYLLNIDNLDIIYHTAMKIEGQYATIEKCNYMDYDFRINHNDGTYIYFNSKNPKNTLDCQLPYEQMELIKAGLDAQMSPVYLSYEANDTIGIYVATDGKNILLNRNGSVINMSSHEIPTDEIEGYDASVAAIGYESVRLMNGGKTLVAGLEMPAGTNGQGENQMAGYLVYDISSGNKKWVMGVDARDNSGINGPRYSQDDKHIMGLVQINDMTTGSSPLMMLNVDTLELSEINDVPSVPDYGGQVGTTMLFDTNDYMTYLATTREALADGLERIEVSYLRDNQTYDLFTAEAPPYVFLNGDLIENNVIYQVTGKTKTLYVIFAIP